MPSDWRPDLSDHSVQQGLPTRDAIYFNLISYCRHIGLRKIEKETATWVARVRKKDGGYKQHALGYAWVKGQPILSYADALKRAEAWFQTDPVRAIASEAFQIGSKRCLNICPIGPIYSVGHALADYLDWKRVAATRSHFETLVSLINYHLVPRVSQVPLDEFNGQHFYDLAINVIETPPKIGRQATGARVPVQRLSDDELRRRKKTLNALISILRGTFDIAWERGELDTDRPKRCLRRVPNVERPRVIFLDRTECRLLHDACHPDLKTLVRAALYTGCRANELIQMRVGDVDSRMNSVFVSSPKGRRCRHVFLPLEGVDFFRALASGRQSSDRLFRKGNGRIWGGEYKSYFQSARGKAGLPSSLTFHGLRHTYASQLVQAGASLMVVAEQLGHVNTQTVSATYGHLVTQQRESEIERCFEPLTDFSSTTQRLRRSTNPENPSPERSDLPKFIHRDFTSWPRSNFSRLTGPLLRELRKSR